MGERIYEAGVDTRELFSVEITDDGRYMAIRSESPRFVLTGFSIAEVTKRAEDVLEFMRKRSARDG